MSLMWALMPRREVTSGFFRIQMLVALGLSVLAALTLQPAEGAGFAVRHASAVCWGLAATAFLGSLFWTLERRRAGAAVGFVMALVSTWLLIGSGVPRTGVAATPLILNGLADVTAAGLLGASVTGMLLGHWYLTAPTMSIAPLNRLNWYFGGAALLRLASVAAGLALSWGAISGGTQYSWLALRLFAGILGPVVLCLMVWRILKYRNTQSATGVLFVGVIFTFIGELTGALLSRELMVAL